MKESRVKDQFVSSAKFLNLTYFEKYFFWQVTYDYRLNLKNTFKPLTRRNEYINEPLKKL